MKVTLAKHGGWQAPLRLPPRVVDGNSLTAAELDELTRLLAAAKVAANASTPRLASLASPLVRGAAGRTT